MFDNVVLTKYFKIVENTTGNEIEVAAFNATLDRRSGLYLNLNIAYPNLYNIYKDDILLEYKQFTADASALAVTMGLATTVEGVSSLNQLKSIEGELRNMTLKVMSEAIQSIGNVTVNPVPIMEQGVVYNHPY